MVVQIFAAGNRIKVIRGTARAVSYGQNEFRRFKFDQNNNLVIAGEDLSEPIALADLRIAGSGSAPADVDAAETALDGLFLSAGGSAISTDFAALSGTNWDANDQPKVTKTISANTAITFSNYTSGRGYLLYVTQSGSSNTISINGSDVVINDTGSTLIGIMVIGSSLAISTNIDGAGAPAVNWLLPTFNATNFSESPAGTFSGPSTSWGNYGLQNAKINAGQSVRWIAQYSSSANFNAALAFMKTLTGPSVPNLDFGITIPGSTVHFTEFHQGVGSGGNLVAISALAVDEWYGIFRDGVTGAVKLQRSTDKTTWLTVYTFAEAYTGDIYLYANCYDTAAKLKNPQYLLL